MHAASPTPAMESEGTLHSDTRERGLEKWLTSDLKVSDEKSLSRELKYMKDYLGITDEREKINWKYRVKAMKRLSEILSNEYMLKNASASKSLLELKPMFISQVLDRRSAVFKASCDMCLDIVKFTRNSKACTIEQQVQLVQVLLELLFKVVPVTIKVMRSAACSTVKEILTNAPDTLERSLMQLVVSHTSHKHERVRAEALSGLRLLVSSKIGPVFPTEEPRAEETRKEESKGEDIDESKVEKKETAALLDSKELSLIEAKETPSDKVKVETEENEQQTRKVELQVPPTGEKKENVEKKKMERKVDPVIAIVKNVILAGVDDSDSNARQQARHLLYEFSCFAQTTGPEIIKGLKSSARKLYESEVKELKSGIKLGEKKASPPKKRNSWKAPIQSTGITIPVLLSSENDKDRKTPTNVKENPDVGETKKKEFKSPVIVVPKEENVDALKLNDFGSPHPEKITKNKAPIGREGTPRPNVVDASTSYEVKTLPAKRKLSMDTDTTDSARLSIAEESTTSTVILEDQKLKENNTKENISRLKVFLDEKSSFINKKMLHFLMEPEVSRLLVRFITRPYGFPDRDIDKIPGQNIPKRSKYWAGNRREFKTRGWVMHDKSDQAEETAVRRSFSVMRLLTDLSNGAQTTLIDERFEDLVDEFLNGFLDECNPNYFHLCKALTFMHRRWGPKFSKILATSDLKLCSKLIFAFNQIHEPMVLNFTTDVFFPPQDLYFSGDAAHYARSTQEQLQAYSLDKILADRCTNKNYGQSMVTSALHFVNELSSRVVEPSSHDSEILAANCHGQILFEKWATDEPWNLKEPTLLSSLVDILVDTKSPQWHRAEVLNTIHHILYVGIQAAQKQEDMDARGKIIQLAQSQTNMCVSDTTLSATTHVLYPERIRDTMLWFLHKNIRKVIQAITQPFNDKKTKPRLGVFEIKIMRLVELMHTSESKSMSIRPSAPDSKCPENLQEDKKRTSMLPLKCWKRLIEIFFHKGMSDAFLSVFESIFISELQRTPAELDLTCSVQFLIKNCNLIGEMMQSISSLQRMSSFSGNILSSIQARVIHLANHLRLKAEVQSLSRGPTSDSPIADLLVDNDCWEDFHDIVLNFTKFQFFDHWKITADAPDSLKRRAMENMNVGLGSPFASKLGYDLPDVKDQESGRPSLVWSADDSSDEDEIEENASSHYLSLNAFISLARNQNEGKESPAQLSRRVSDAAMEKETGGPAETSKRVSDMQILEASLNSLGDGLDDDDD